MLHIHTLIHNDIENFWLDRTNAITDENSLTLFVREYMALLGIDYDTSIAKVLLRLQSLHIPSIQPLVDDFVSLTTAIRRERDAATRLQLWQKVAELAHYNLQINHLDVQLTSKAAVTTYFKTLLSATHSPLWPPHEIAYKLVNVMAHYDIQKSDYLLYTIWDLATDMETMTISEIEASGVWNKMVQLSKKLS